MAQFYSAKPKKTKHLSKKVQVEIQSVDHQAQGVTQHDGKVLFVPGLLPGEVAQVQITEHKARFARARVAKRVQEHPDRQAPDCPHFGRCGGCQLQYAPNGLQRALKQQALASLVERQAGLVPESWATPLKGPDWGYRRRARLAARYDNGQLQLGFRQGSSNAIVAIDACPVLEPALDALLTPLQRTLAAMKLARHLGHVDLMRAKEGVVVVLRLMRPLRVDEAQRLATFEQDQQCRVLVKDNEKLAALDGGDVAPLHYQIGDQLPPPAFLPGDFYQVNDVVNRAMVAQALAWLSPQPGERGLDLFCGGGNFSLALAAQGAEVIAVEGVPTMVQRGRARARQLGLDQLRFEHADLNGDAPKADWLHGIDWALLDPARDGAMGVMQWLAELKPSRVLYVSCNPASLARDAKVLAQAGYGLKRLGLVDMFPHTHHLESMALFVPDPRQ